MTYKAIAAELARRRGVENMSAHAVGGAVSHNPISLIIPCHRVVGTNGSLTGYAGGIDKKVRLLSLEKADQSRLFIVDPIDGTTNFIKDYHMSAISVGLALNGERYMGVVYNPYLNELFTAVKGQGAFLNGAVF